VARVARDPFEKRKDGVRRALEELGQMSAREDKATSDAEALILASCPDDDLCDCVRSNRCGNSADIDHLVQRAGFVAHVVVLTDQFDCLISRPAEACTGRAFIG
jgi:hypothetical protein